MYIFLDSDSIVTIPHIPHMLSCHVRSGSGEADLVALGSVLSACEAVSAWRHALALLSGGERLAKQHWLQNEGK
jgi:hypothetical protein